MFHSKQTQARGTFSGCGKSQIHLFLLKNTNKQTTNIALFFITSICFTLKQLISLSSLSPSSSSAVRWKTSLPQVPLGPENQPFGPSAPQQRALFISSPTFKVCTCECMHAVEAEFGWWRWGGAEEEYVGGACCSLARGQTWTRTPTFMQLIKLCRERGGPGADGAYGPGSVWEVRDRNGGYISYRSEFAVRRGVAINKTLL